MTPVQKRLIGQRSPGATSATAAKTPTRSRCPHDPVRHEKADARDHEEHARDEETEVAMVNRAGDA